MHVLFFFGVKRSLYHVEILNRLPFGLGSALILLVGTGIYLSLRLGLLQIFSSSAPFA